MPAVQIAADPLISLPMDNGGSSATMALNPGSAAIEAGATCAGPPPPTDQRGLGRVAGMAPNLGAYAFDTVASDSVFADGFAAAAAGCL